MVSEASIVELKPVNETHKWTIKHFRGNTIKCFHQRNTNLSQIYDWGKKEGNSSTTRMKGWKTQKQMEKANLGHGGIEDRLRRWIGKDENKPSKGGKTKTNLWNDEGQKPTSKWWKRKQNHEDKRDWARIKGELVSDLRRDYNILKRERERKVVLWGSWGGIEKAKRGVWNRLRRYTMRILKP